MKKLLDDYIYSPTDLTAFFESEFATWMERFNLDFPGVVTPDPVDEEEELLFKKGQAHEKAFLEDLYSKGHDICEIPSGENRYLVTQEALKDGREIVYQAALMKGQFSGLADFIVRVDIPSLFGSFSYEVGDTKLSRKAKPTHIIQLCCYAEMLENLQGIRPQWIHVMLGNGETKRFRTNDYFYYYRQIKQAFLEQQEAFDPKKKPIPTYGDNFGQWTSHAESLLEQIDHLSRVANITKSQIKRLEGVGIRTLTSLATTELPSIPKMETSIYTRLQHQARLQLESATLDKPKFELLEHTVEEGGFRYGLELLPPASPLDIYFDMEGYPLLDGGLEYLFGMSYLENGELQFKDWWAHNRTEEKLAFEGFIDWAYQRWKQDPNMHIYHYAAYEVTAIRKLMGRFGTREKEVDDLLRNEVFADLYQIVRQSLRVGEPKYSIKNIEHLYMEARSGDVKNAGASIVYYEKWLETQDGQGWSTSHILNEIRNYNKDDCDSTYKLTEWLRTLQKDFGISYHIVEKVEAEPQEEDEQADSPATLAKAILASIPEDHDEQDEEYRIPKLLAWLLEFHRRDAKPIWWRYFDRLNQTSEELVNDHDCIGLLSRTGNPPEAITKLSNLYEFSFNPNQDTKLTEGKKCYLVLSNTTLKTAIEWLDSQNGLLKIKLSHKALQKAGLESQDLTQSGLSLIPDEFVSADAIETAIYKAVKTWWETGELQPALNDFLRRNRPRMVSLMDGPLIPETMDALQGTINAVLGLDNSVLCIQGPPGAGKTYTGAQVVLDLLKRGKTVGITSNSHKAVVNLMREVAAFAVNQHVSFMGAKVGDADESLSRFSFIQQGVEIKNINVSIIGGVQLVGGTAWTFSKDCVEGKFDYLFVDEAGQVSIANLVGMAACTSNIVLLGDQMQLSQPIQGSHPGESGLSILDYYLQGQATIPPDKGVFLGKTHRLHPNICEFISDTVYDGRLLSVEEKTAHRVLSCTDLQNALKYGDAGIVYVPVPHEGNSQCSEEEVEIIQTIVDCLLGYQYIDKQGKQVPLMLEDILFVAPYNMQVRLLQDALGQNARVGSVDKFQGQEAPVVIVSMCASSGNDSPRGLDFLLCKNRMNVALSRAQTLAIVVGSPTLALTRCSTIEQMSLVNLYCRIVQEFSWEEQKELLGNV